MLHHPVIAADWTADPVASSILASFATNPPTVESIPYHERWDREDTRFAGERVDQLVAVRSALLDAAFLEAEAAGDDEAVAAIVAQPTVQDAVAHVIRIPVLSLITVQVVDLDPAAWDYAIFDEAA